MDSKPAQNRLKTVEPETSNEKPETECVTSVSKLVADVKTYSHMDRAGGFEPLDVTIGLESTLNMLGFQLRQKSVRVVMGVRGQS